MERAAGRDEGFHQPAGQIERTALAQLIAAFQVECANHRAHRRSLRQSVHQPRAEQGYFEQEQETYVFVLEQFAHDIERLAIGDFEEFTPQRRPRQQRLAFFFR